MNEEIKNIIEATSMGKLEKEAVIKSLLNLHSVSNHIVCDGCGDTGRGKPTLQEPDGVDCEKCSSK